MERWLTAKQLAGEFALTEESAYRWHKQGRIPAGYVKRSGTRPLLFHPDAVAELQRQFEAR